MSDEANQIFISYRREDTSAITGRIYDHLVGKFGRGAVFKDVDSIPIGHDYRVVLDSIVSRCSVVLVVIGAKWHRRDRNGKHRLDDPGDFVRIEVESALRRAIPVIPLLVQRAKLPPAESLPESLKDLAYRQATSIGEDPRFHADVARLINYLETILPPPPALIKPAPPPLSQRPTGDLDVDNLVGIIHPVPPDPDDGGHEPQPPVVPPAPGPEPDGGETPPAKPEGEVEPEDSKPVEVGAEAERHEEAEPAAVWALYPLVLLLGAAFPVVSALWGLLAGRYAVEAFVHSLEYESDLYPSMLFAAEMFAAYSVAAVGFLVGMVLVWKRLHNGRGMTWWIAAVPFLINFGGFLHYLFKEKTYVNHVFFLGTTFLMMPLMPLLAYLGLHLGMRYSARRATRKAPPPA